MASTGYMKSNRSLIKTSVSYVFPNLQELL